jgi:Tfp pilus assembly protein PilF
MMTGSSEGRPDRRRISILVAVILTAAAAVRITFLIQLSGSDLGAMLPLDMRFYHELGVAMASGAGLPAGGLTFNPLYPVFLAGVFRIFGDGLLVPRIIQTLAGIMTLWLIYLSARILAGGFKECKSGSSNSKNAAGLTDKGTGGLDRSDVAGISAAALALFYPQLLLYEGSLLATSLVTLIMAASFLLTLRLSRSFDGEEMRIFGRSASPAACAAFLGILVGAGIMGRPNIFLFLAPLVAVWIAVVSRSKGRGWKAPALFIAGLVVILAPASIYNASRTGTLAPVSSHGGINLYIGNMRDARGLYNPPAGMRRDMRGLIEDSRAYAEKTAGRRLSDAEVSAFWSDRARDRIVTDTGGWLLLLGRKLLLFWNGGELGDIVDIDLMRQECPVFTLLAVRFALISALAFVGAVLLVRFSPGRWPFIIFIAPSIAAIVLFYFNTRYRLPSLPVLAASAGYAVAWTVGKISARRWKEPVIAALAAAAFFAAVSSREMFTVNRSATFTFLGNHYMTLEEDAKAMRAFAEAVRLDPGGVENMINYARVLSRADRKQEARRYYQRAWEAAPDFPRLALEYGYLLDGMGKRAEAGTMYNHAWNSGRRNEKITACKLLSRMAYAEGDVSTAIMWVRRALDLAPGDEELLKLLDRLEGP